MQRTFGHSKHLAAAEKPVVKVCVQMAEGICKPQAIAAANRGRDPHGVPDF